MILKEESYCVFLYIWITTNKNTIMNYNYLYHAWGLYTLRYTSIECKGNTIVLNIESKRTKKHCPKCRKYHLVKNGYRTRDFLGLPIGGKRLLSEWRYSAINARTMIMTNKNRLRLPMEAKVILFVLQSMLLISWEAWHWKM